MEYSSFKRSSARVCSAKIKSSLSSKYGGGGEEETGK
jgi:hypothetical protein